MHADNGPESELQYMYYGAITELITHILYIHTLEEDILTSYSRILLKMFLSEGVMCGHSLFLASASEDPAEMIKVYTIMYTHVQCIYVCLLIRTPLGRGRKH